jgi:cytochrome c-type biogenesis protein
MEQLFTNLGHAVEGAPLLALGAAFAWGILSILLSPCHLASLPLIVGFISGQGVIGVRRAFSISTLFAAGILVTVALIGVLTAAAGRLMGDIGTWGNYLVAVIFFAVGLHLVGVVPMPFTGPDRVKMKSRGLLAGFVLGLVFGIALGPCTFAFMAPVLGVTFRTAQTAWLYAVSLLLAYALGHCAVIIAAGTSAEMVQRFLDWNERSHAVRVVKSACGILVFASGGYLIYTAH